MPTNTYDHLAPQGGVVVDPGQLDVLGKQAAVYAEGSGLSLTEAVVHTIGQEKLSAEHVRRIVEIANTEAFNKKFSSLDPSCRIVNLEGGPADPASVLSALEYQARPRDIMLDTFEYSAPPENNLKFASSHDFLPERTAGGARQDILNLHYKLASAHEEAVQSREASRYCMVEALTKLAQTTITAAHDGATAAEVFTAWSSVDPDLAKLAYDKVRHVFHGPTTKVAGRSINENHALVAEFREFVKQATAYVAYTNQTQTLEQESIRVDGWIKSHLEA